MKHYGSTSETSAMTSTKDRAKNILLKKSKKINENVLSLIPLILNQLEKAAKKIYYIKHLTDTKNKMWYKFYRINQKSYDHKL